MEIGAAQDIPASEMKPLSDRPYLAITLSFSILYLNLMNDIPVWLKRIS
jgi:hypothetical protein